MTPERQNFFRDFNIVPQGRFSYSKNLALGVCLDWDMDILTKIGYFLFKQKSLKSNPNFFFTFLNLLRRSNKTSDKIFTNQIMSIRIWIAF